MSVELARVDERLIHGQVMTAWVEHFWIQRIVLVDDELAQDEFMKQVLAMSAPAGVTVDVKTARAAGRGSLRRTAVSTCCCCLRRSAAPLPW